MCEEDKHSAISLIVEFITKIGLSVEYTLLENTTPVPGINIEQGSLYVDRPQLLYPGELLYQAGKIAVSPPMERAQLNGQILYEPCDDMMVIAWCWAALNHLDLSSEVMLYTSSHSGSPNELIDKFNAGRFFGVPLLQWAGMTNEPTRDLNGSMVVFPAMTKWLRD